MKVKVWFWGSSFHLALTMTKQHDWWLFGDRSILLRLTMEGDSQLDGWFTYLVLLLFAGTASFWVIFWFLHVLFENVGHCYPLWSHLPWKITVINPLCEPVAMVHSHLCCFSRFLTWIGTARSCCLLSCVELVGAFRYPSTPSNDFTSMLLPKRLFHAAKLSCR